MFDDYWRTCCRRLEKGSSRHHISEDQQFQENTQKFIYYQKMKVARKGERKE
jgi:hypothetical protein